METWSDDLEGCLAGPYVVERRERLESHAAIFTGRSFVGEKRVELKVLSRAACDIAGRLSLGSAPLLHEYRVAVRLGPRHVTRHLDTGFLSDGLPFLARELPSE